MDEFTLVARLRSEMPGIDLAGPENRLAAEIAAAQTGPAAANLNGPGGQPSQIWAGGRRTPRGRRRLIVTGALAAAAAVIAATALIAVRGQDAHAPGSAGASLHPSASPAPGPAATAAQLVAYATRAAAGAPVLNLKPHEWVYTKTLLATSASGQGDVLFGPPTGSAVTPYWSRVDGHESAFLVRGKLQIVPGGGPPGGAESSSYQYLESLTTNPAKLRAILQADAGRGRNAVFNAIENMLQSPPLPPRLLAALYRVLASDPAVHFDPRVTDFAGQTGVAFYTLQEGYLKDEIVISPRTYAFMGSREVAYRPHSMLKNSGDPADGTIRYRKGQIVSEGALLEVGIVQQAGQVPAVPLS